MDNKVGEEEEEEDDEKGYERYDMDIGLLIASFGKSSIWQSIHVTAIFLQYMYSTSCYAFKAMPFSVNWIWIINLVSFFDFTFKLLIQNYSKVKRLSDYETVSKLYLFEDVINVIPLSYTYLMYETLSKEVMDLFEYSIIFANVLRLHQLYSYYYSRSNNTLGHLTPSFVALKLIMLFLWSVHTGTIFWVIHARNEWKNNNQVGWIPSYEKANQAFFDEYLNDGSVFYWYFMGFYYVSNTAITVGFAEFRNETTLEQRFNDVTVIVGYVILTGVFTTYFDQSIQVSLMHNSVHHFRTALIHEILRTSDLRNAIERYYRDMWKETKGIGEPETIKEIPPSLARQIQLDIFSKAIHNCYILKNIPEYLSMELASKMTIKSYVAGDLIVKRGMVAYNMIYIAQGSVDLLSDEDDSSSLMILGEGSILCTSNLIIVRPAKVSIRAKGFTTTHQLNVNDFLDFINKYRYLLPKIMANIEGTLNETYGKYVHLSMTAEDSPVVNISSKRDELFSLKTRLMSLHENKITDRTKKWFVQNSPMYNMYMINEWKRKALEKELLRSTPSIYVYLPIKEKEELHYDDACLIPTFPWVINPASSFINIWKIILLIVTTMSLIVIPIFTSFTKYKSETMVILCVVIDIVYIIDFLISLLTPDDSVKIKEKSSVITHNLKKITTYMDFVAIFPIYICFIQRTSDSLLWRTNTFLYARKVITYFKSLEENHVVGLTLIAILKYLYFVFIGSIMMGCYFFMVSCFPVDNCNPKGWFMTLKNTAILTSDTQNQAPLIVSVWFSEMVLSQMGIGFVIPLTFSEYCLCIAFMIVTIIVSRYLLATYSAALALNDSQREKMEDFAKSALHFLNNVHAPRSIIVRMSAYMEVQWNRNQGFTLLENTDVLWDLPTHLREQYNWENYNCLAKLPFIRILAEGTNRDFLQHLCNHVEKITLPSNDVVTYSGARDDCFYILLNGYCKLIDKNNKVLKVVEKDSMINFLESLCGTPLMHNVVTYTACNLLIIKWDFLYALITFHLRGDLVKIINQKAEECISVKVDYTSLRHASEEHIVVITETEKVYNWISFYGGELEAKIEYLEPFSKLGFFQIIKHLMLKFTFTPYGKFVFYWEIVRIICAFLSAIVIPPINYFTIYNNLFYLVVAVLDLTALVDIYIQMHVCYYNEQNILITHPLKTAQNYIYNSFMTDFIALFPINYIYPLEDIQGKSDTRCLGVSVQMLLPFNRILQMWRYDAFFQVICNKTVRPNPLWRVLHYTGLTVAFLTTLNTLVIMITLVFYYSDTNPLDTIYLVSPNWYTDESDKNFGSIYQMYEMFLTSLATVTGLAYCVSTWNIIPKDTVTFYVMFCVVMFGYIFSNWILVKLISTRAKMNPNVSTFHNNFIKLIEFLKKTDVSTELRRAIKDYFDYLWLETEGVYEEAVFTSVHDSLKTDCLMCAYAPTFLKVGPFTSLPPHCLRDISKIVKKEFVCKNVNVLTPNVIFKEIYIVRSGRVAYYDHLGALKQELYPGSIFGNFYSTDYVKSISTIRTIENTSFLVMEYNDLLELSEKYQELKRVMNMLDKSQKTYIPVDRVDTSNTFHDDVPDWIMRLVDYKNHFSAVLFANCALVIYFIASFISTSNFAYDVPYSLQYAILCDAFFLFDTYLRCNTPYYDYQAQAMVRNKRIIKKRYMKTFNFHLRLIVILPLYIIPLLPFFPENYRKITIKYLMLNKTLYVYFTLNYLNAFMSRIDINLIFYKTLSSIFTTTMSVHIFTCIFQLARCNRDHVCKVTSSKPSGNYVSCTVCDDNSYMCNLYFVLQIVTTSGLGDMLPCSDIQKLVTIIIIILGVIVMSSFIGDMVDILHLSKENYTNYSYQVSLLLNYMRINRIPQPRITEQFKYCERLWYLQDGTQLPTFFFKMPTYLKREVHIQLYGRNFMDNFIFAAVPKEFLKQVLIYLERNVYMSGNTIITKDENSETLYLVLQGSVACKDGSTVVSTLSSGDFFGLRNGLYMDLRSMYTYVALMTTNIVQLKLSSWKHIMDFYPSARSEIYYRAVAAGITPKPNRDDFIKSSQIDQNLEYTDSNDIDPQTACPT